MDHSLGISLSPCPQVCGLLYSGSLLQDLATSISVRVLETTTQPREQMQCRVSNVRWLEGSPTMLT
jgi:hypothetical protein